MGQSSRSRLTPFGRRLLVDRVQTGGWTPAQATEAAGVSRQTVYRWLRRFETEGEAGLEDRSSRPRPCPARLPTEAENRIAADRLTEREGPHLMAGRLGIPRSTIYAVPARRGLSRLAALDRTTGVPIRYVRDCPGELVHIDIKTLGRVPHGGGWRIHERANAGPRQGVGYEYIHSMIDDHSRFAYTEALDSQNAAACAGFLPRSRPGVRRPGIPHRTSHDRQRLGLPQKPALRRRDGPDRRRSLIHPPLPAADQRQGRTLPPDPVAGLGLQTGLHQQPATASSPSPVHRILQSPATPQLTRRPNTQHQTCKPPLWEGQLESRTDT